MNDEIEICFISNYSSEIVKLNEMLYDIKHLFRFFILFIFGGTFVRTVERSVKFGKLYL